MRSSVLQSPSASAFKPRPITTIVRVTDKLWGRLCSTHYRRCSNVFPAAINVLTFNTRLGKIYWTFKLIVDEVLLWTLGMMKSE
jgi:hypothetical protein